MFQSSPAREGGRYQMLATDKQLLDQFQSSPAREGGRYLGRDSPLQSE